MLTYFKNYFARKNIWFIVTIGVVIIVCLLYFFIYPSISSLATTTAEIERMTDTLIENSQSASIQSTLALFNKLNEKEELFHKSIPSRHRQLEFITAIEDIAEKFSVEQKINFNEITPVPDNDKFFTNTLQLWLQGTFKNNLRVIEAIERLPFYINAEKITINSSTAADRPNLANVFINATIYWQ